MNKKLKTLLIIVLLIFMILLVYLFILRYAFFNNIENSIAKYNNPIVPNGFEKVETESASWELDENGIPKGWNSGLVIQDETGNEFVWVPVDSKNVSYKIEEVESMGSADLPYYTHLPNGIKNEYSQITKYGGFYAGRYEAGLPKELQELKEGYSISSNNIIALPIIKKESIVWNKVNATNAIKSAEQLYNTNEIKSGLITLSQWLTLMEWLENSGYDVNNNSKEWGNYSNASFLFNGWYSTDSGENYKYGNNKEKRIDNMLLSAGASERNKANNIYDLAGNLYEYTSTYSWANTYVYAGGNYDNTGLDSSNKTSLYYDVNSKIGFRIVLFLE